jgi:hypothetical protein
MPYMSRRSQLRTERAMHAKLTATGRFRVDELLLRSAG